VERRDDAAAAQPDKGGAQQLVWQLGQQLGTGIVPGQGKSRSIQSFLKLFYNFINRKFISLQKFSGEDNWKYQKLPQPWKDQYLPWAVHGGREVLKVTPWTKLPRRRVHEAHP
jgi:hypothetical protein